MNAKKEFEQLVRSTDAEVDCAEVTADIYDIWEPDDPHTTVEARLRQNWNEADMAEFLDELDFEYDHGYGAQFVFGTVWFKDGSWAARQEYDGSESWSINVRPNIPAELRGMGGTNETL